MVLVGLDFRPVYLFHRLSFFPGGNFLLALGRKGWRRVAPKMPRKTKHPFYELAWVFARA